MSVEEQKDIEMKSSNVMDDGDFLDHLKENDFMECEKLERAMKAGQWTVNEILDCNENELEDVLQGIGTADPVQRKRFVKALEKIPESRMNKHYVEINVVLNGEKSEKLLLWDDSIYMQQLDRKYRNCTYFFVTRAGVYEELKTNAKLEALIFEAGKHNIVEIEVKTKDFGSSKQLRQEKAKYDEKKKNV